MEKVHSNLGVLFRDMKLRLKLLNPTDQVMSEDQIVEYSAQKRRSQIELECEPALQKKVLVSSLNKSALSDTLAAKDIIPSLEKVEDSNNTSSNHHPNSTNNAPIPEEDSGETEEDANSNQEQDPDKYHKQHSYEKKIKILKEALIVQNIRKTAFKHNLSPGLVRAWRKYYGNIPELRQLNHQFEKEKSYPKKQQIQMKSKAQSATKPKKDAAAGKQSQQSKQQPDASSTSQEQLNKVADLSTVDLQASLPPQTHTPQQ